MWVFCREGFFSAVRHWDDPGFVLVRGRFQGDLERLAKAYLNREIRVQHTPDADYAYRMVLTKNEWSEALKHIAQDIDYSNFKDSVHEGLASPRDTAYMGCWWNLRQGQEVNERACRKP